MREGITHLVLFITFAIDSFDSPWTVGHVFFILSLGWDLDLVVFFFLWELRGVDYASFGLHSGKYTDKSAFHPQTTQAAGAPATSTGAAGNV